MKYILLSKMYSYAGPLLGITQDDAGVSGIFTNLAGIFAIISLTGIGAIMAGYFLFPEQATKYKREIPTVIVGLVLVAVGGIIVGALTGG